MRSATPTMNLLLRAALPLLLLQIMQTQGFALFPSFPMQPMQRHKSGLAQAQCPLQAPVSPMHPNTQPQLGMGLRTSVSTSRSRSRGVRLSMSTEGQEGQTQEGQTQGPDYSYLQRDFEIICKQPYSTGKSASVCVCMYVCMYVCVYVCIYVCMRDHLQAAIQHR
jgi:hypothetical protein